MALVLSTHDDAGVHGAVGPVCGDDATVMALQKRTDILEFHGFFSCSYPYCVQTRADARNAASRHLLTIALFGPENHVTVRVLLAFPP
jgi:hypothetical protein